MTLNPLFMLFRFVIAAIAGLWLAGSASQRAFSTETSGTSAQLRGVSAASDNVVWASGSQGTYLRTTDGGRVWTVGTVPDGSQLDFRDVEAVDANTAYLLATAGKIFKTVDGGRNWTLQYNNSSRGVFLDAFAFWDSTHGIALGDPINGSFLILSTSDGGSSWIPIPAARIPGAIDGEAAFAASGTCITAAGNGRVWFVTGGKAARVFRSSDYGKTWTVAETPLVRGVDSTGGFSIAFGDESNGVIVGGDYKKPTVEEANAALTRDGGVTWIPVKRRPGGYRSGVAYVPGTSVVIAVGEAGIDFSTDGGNTWMSVGKEGYHAVGISSSKAGWAVGSNGRITKIEADGVSERR
jgi:photosystem II stability/assembly factor-like uncharacterized protein